MIGESAVCLAAQSSVKTTATSIGGAEPMVEIFVNAWPILRWLFYPRCECASTIEPTPQGNLGSNPGSPSEIKADPR